MNIIKINGGITVMGYDDSDIQVVEASPGYIAWYEDLTEVMRISSEGELVNLEAKKVLQKLSVPLSRSQGFQVESTRQMLHALVQRIVELEDDLERATCLLP